MSWLLLVAQPPPTRGSDDAIPLLRVIGRLVGGAAIQAVSLSRVLDDYGYRTTLLRGRVEPNEVSMEHLVDEYGVVAGRVPGMRRSLGPHDALAAAWIWNSLRRERPVIVHTHAAKGGTVGRLAATLTPRWRRPEVIVHSFHGHVLTGYFSPTASWLFTFIERRLGARTTAIIAVSEEVKADLARLRVAPPERIFVVPLGFELQRFGLEPAARAEARARTRLALGFRDQDRVVTLVGRLSPIKRVDRFLAVARRVSAADDAVRFLIAGDGELRAELRASSDARDLGDRVVWAGVRRDMPEVYAASDVVVLTSDNEGTPVSLIEAHAAELPVVSTRVGGVSAVVQDGVSGRVLPVDDVEGMAAAISCLLNNPRLARTYGAAGQRYVLAKFSLDRLVSDMDTLYRRLLSDAAPIRRARPLPSSANGSS